MSAYRNDLNFLDTQSNSETPTKPSSQRLSNFASAECGAKVRGYNAESTNAGFILTNNHDEYMNNVCSATDKWFVRVFCLLYYVLTIPLHIACRFIVELCEPMQIRAIEMGNLELFSSVYRTFRVFSSDRLLP